MSIERKRITRAALRTALLGGTATLLAGLIMGVGSFAYAQDQDTDDDEAVVEEIIVTGSRIKRAGFETLQPATVVDAEFMALRGFDNPAQALNEIPQFGLPAATNLGGQSSNNLGQNIVNLFGLGSQRTLTLINGRRTVGQNTPNVGGAAAPGLQVDLNIIPTGLIDRIETIETGGAPIYGSDAISGTVNIILKDDFEGISADVGYGANEGGDGQNFRFRTLLGGNFDNGRGNVVISFEYNKQNPVDAQDRPDLIPSPAFVPNPLDTGPGDGIVDSIFTDDSLNVWQVPNTGFILFGNDAVVGLQDANGNPTYNGFLSGVQVLPTNAQGELMILGLNGNLVTLESANLGIPFPSAVSFFSSGADGGNNPFVSELDELNTFVSPLERFTMNALGHYEITDNITIFYEGLFARSESVDRSNQPSWSTLFFDNANNGALGNYKINTTHNPFVSQELKDLLELNDRFDPTLVDDPATADVDESDQFFWVSRSNIDILGDSQNFRDQDVFRFVSGFEGNAEFMGRVFDWEIAYTFGQTNASTLQTVVDGARLSFATDVLLDDRLQTVDNPDFDDTLPIDPVTNPEFIDVPVDDDTFGAPICRVTFEGTPDPEDSGGIPGTGTNADFADCLAIDILTFGSASPEALDYVLARQSQSTRLQQSVVEASIAGDIFDLPAGPLGFAAGIVHRRERAAFDIGQGSKKGPPPNPPQVAVAGGFNTWEAYVEGRAPIIANGEGIGGVGAIIQDLTLEGAVRIVDNNRSGSAYTWTAGGRLTPAPGGGMITFRGNYTKAIRSPAVTELFLPQVSIGTFATDPCDQRDIASGNNPAVRAANCQAAVAALAATLDPTFDLNTFRAISRNASQAAITGGNPNLRNERSRAYSFGAIITPDALVPGLRISVDWTDIIISDAIVNLSATNILSACFDSADFPNEPSCSRFQRDPFTFQPGQFITGFVNAAAIRFQGLTVQATYDFDLADLSSSMNGNVRINTNYFMNAKNDQKVGSGDLNIRDTGRGFERHKYQANITYSLDKFTGFLQVRGDFGGYFSPDDVAAGDDEARDIDKFDGYHQVNVSLRYQLNENFWLQTNVNNLLNAANSKLRQASVGSNTNTLDDPLGRFFLVSAGASF